MALTKTYTIEIEGSQAVATVGQLKAEIEKLEAEMDGVALGSKEADAAIRRLGQAKGALKELEDAVDALDPKQKAAAFLDFTNGIVGGFGICSVAAQNFGLLSKGSAEEVEAKMLQVITVLQSVEAVQKALNSETQSNIKAFLSASKAQIAGILGIGNSWTIAGVKAKLFGTTTRAALTATGIGAIIVLIGTLIANWDTVTKKVTQFKDTVAKAFPGVGMFIDGLVDKARDLANFLSFGFIDDAATAAAKKLEEKEKAAAQVRVNKRARLIAELEAEGKDTYALKKKQLEDELKLIDKSSEDYAKLHNNKLSQIRVLNIQHENQVAADKEKATKEEEEKRKAALDKAAKDREEWLRKEEEAYNKLRESQKQATAEELAAREEARNLRLAMAQATGADEARIVQVEIENLKDMQADLLSQGQKNTAAWYTNMAAIREKETRLVDISIEKQREETAIRKAELDKQVADKQQQIADLQASNQSELLRMQANGATQEELNVKRLFYYREELAKMEELEQTGTDAYRNLMIAEQALTASLFKSRSALGQWVEDVFGSGANERLEQFFHTAVGVLDGLLADSMLQLDAQAQLLDARMEDLQEKRLEIESQLQDSQSRLSDLEKQADDAKGARRESLIRKISLERIEEKKLLDAKKAAAKEEEKLAKDKEALEQKRQELEARGRLVTEASTAASAVKAGVEAVAGAASLGFPAMLPAILVAVASVGAAIMSAKKLAGTIQQAKFENGGTVKGPSHALGGVPFTVKGSYASYEMEGEEEIVNKRASALNRDEIKKINALGHSMRFVAIPAHQVRRFSEGGTVPGNGPSAADYRGGTETTPVPNATLSRIEALLGNIESNTARAADNKPVLAIGNREAYQITQAAQEEKDDMNAGQLLK